eukprot:g453.t1
MTEHPKSVDEIFEDYCGRRTGLTRALTDDLDDFYQQCDPERENLCLYGDRDGTWSVDLPSEEVPPELPEPCLGINFARDGMQKRDWLALVAVHSDSWLYAVAFYYGAKLDQNERLRMFKLINQHPTLFEVVTERERGRARVPTGTKRKKPEIQPPSRQPAHLQQSTILEAHTSPKPHGKLLTTGDISEAIVGREAELFWPDDQKWYMVRIQHIDVENKTARIAYISGEVEDLDMNEIASEGHLSLLPLDH